MGLPQGRTPTAKLLLSVATVLLVSYITVAVTGLVWFEHEHGMRHHMLRDEQLVINTRISERYVTPGWWSKALTLWRMLVVLASLVVVSRGRGKLTPALLDAAFRVILIGVLLELFIFVYLLLERYALGCNSCIYSPNTCHGRAFCDKCFAEFPDVCPNDVPVQVTPDRGISRYWRRRTTASGFCLALGLGLLITVWLVRKYGGEEQWLTKREAVADVAWAQQAHTVALFALCCTLGVLMCWGLHSFSWFRVAVAESPEPAGAPAGQQPPLRKTDARFGLSWFAFAATTLTVGTIMSGACFLVTWRARWLETLHTLSVLGAIVVMAAAVTVCTVGLYMCNTPVWPYNPCHDRRFCCAHTDALKDVVNRCVGIVQNCPDPLTGSGVGLLSKTQLHANRPFQIVYVSSGFGLLFSVCSYMTLYVNKRARSRLRAFMEE